MRKFIQVAVLLLLAMLVMVAPAFSQSTTVSGTVSDAGFQSWNNGTITFTFTPNPNNPFPPQYTWTGGTIPATVAGVLSGTGTYSVSVPSNTAITPGDSTWIVTVCPDATSPCWNTTALVVTGATQTFNITPPAIVIDMVHNYKYPTRAYSDTEVVAAFKGMQYYYLPSNVYHYCNASTGTTCTSWAAIGSGGAGTVISVAMTTPSWLSVAGSPITTGGTLAVSPATGQTSHQVIGTCGAATTFTPCALVAGDLPTISLSTGVNGTLQAGQFPVLTGDVNTSGGSLTTSVIGLRGNVLPSLSAGYLNWTGSAWALTAVSGSGTVNNPNGNFTLATPLVSANSTVGAASSPIYYDATQCTGADMAAKINDCANNKVPSTGGNVKASAFQGAQTLTTNMLASVTSKGILIDVCGTQGTVTATQVLVASSIVQGCVQGGTGGRGSYFVAAGGLGANPMFAVGTTGTLAHSQLKYVTLDCANVTGCINFQNEFGQENTGAENVTMNNAPAIGLDVETSGAQNSYYKNLYIQPLATSVANTKCAVFLNAVSLRGLDGVTCNASGYSVQPTNGITIDNTQMFLGNGQIQSVVNGVNIGSINTTNGSVLSNLHFASVTNAVTISNANVVQNIALFGIGAASSTNALNDLATGCTYSGAVVGMYVLGANNGSGQYNRYSTLNTTGCLFTFGWNFNMYATNPTFNPPSGQYTVYVNSSTGALCTWNNAGTSNCGGGGTPGGTQYGVQYNGVGGVFAGVTPPTVNGIYNVIYNVTAGAAVAPTTALGGVPVDATNPATLLYSDRASYMNWTTGTALALPAVTGNFASNFPFVLQNSNTSTLTITPNATAVDLIDGASSGTLIAKFASFVYQDSSSAPGHWFTIKFPTFAAFGATCANPISWSTTTGFSCLSGTSGGVPYFSAANTWGTSAALGLGHVLLGGGAGAAPSSDTNLDDGQTTANTLTYAGTGGIKSASLYATGIVDGLSTVNVSTTTPCTLGTASANCSAVNSSAGYTVNQHATAAQAIVYNLPTAAKGLQYCVRNGNNGSAANTGTLELLTSATGQFILYTDGTYTATHGNVTSTGAAGDSACVVGVDTTHWMLYVQSGSWTKN
jgi:hypothetical protein